MWQANQNPGAGVKGEPGSLAWTELITPQPDVAARFFESLLGVVTEAMPMDEGAYTIVRAAGEDVAGIMETPPMMQGVPPAWTIYFAVEDTEDTAARAASLGATLLVGPQDTPAGRFAVLQDPQGAVFSVIKLSEAM